MHGRVDWRSGVGRMYCSNKDNINFGGLRFRWPLPLCHGVSFSSSFAASQPLPIEVSPILFCDIIHLSSSTPVLPRPASAYARAQEQPLLNYGPAFWASGILHSEGICYEHTYFLTLHLLSEDRNEHCQFGFSLNFILSGLWCYFYQLGFDSARPVTLKWRAWLIV